MLNPRVCPHCNKQIATDRGYFFDEHLNMICRNCNLKVVEIKEEPVVIAGEEIDETV